MRRGTAGTVLALAALLAAAPALAADHAFSAGPQPLSYSSDSITIDQGDTITFANNDSSGARHDVTATKDGTDGKAVFKSATIDPGKTAPVEGVDFLTAGDYTYFCSVHPDFMKGTLHVTTNGTPKTGTPPDTIPPTGHISITDSRIAPVLKRGALRIALKADEPSRFKLTAKSGKTTLATAVVTLKDKTRTASMKLTRAGRKLLAKAKKATVKVSAVVNDAANNKSAATATRSLKR